jgi:hypothetical protein
MSGSNNAREGQLIVLRATTRGERWTGVLLIAFGLAYSVSFYALCGLSLWRAVRPIFF